MLDLSDISTEINIDVGIEPQFMALGPTHVLVMILHLTIKLGVGRNNHWWFYRTSGDYSLVHERDYMGTVENVQLNATYAAILYEGQVLLHSIEKCNYCIIN